MTHPEAIYHGETPTETEFVSTTNSAGWVTANTTVSTETTFTIGSDGVTIPETIYHRETPPHSEIVSTTYAAGWVTANTKQIT